MDTIYDSCRSYRSFHLKEYWTIEKGRLVLVELKKLNIINDGYNRKVSLDKMYVNTDHIISITDYVNINGYLLSEEFSKKSFSLLKIGTWIRMNASTRQ